VLLKQDKSEATMAVNGRLEFIEKEMSVLLRFEFLAGIDQNLKLWMGRKGQQLLPRSI
jgi:hypothetical protein